MRILVQKFGGTSVADIDRLKMVRGKVKAALDQGYKVVVVLSAKSGKTNKLLDLSTRWAAEPDLAEVDSLLSTGEQASIALFSMLLKDSGIKARSMLGWQIPIITNDEFGRARILSIDASRIHKELEAHDVLVVAGFQGIDANGDITPLGRGGSDTTAVAIAWGINADVCEIYSDVDGVYTTDPRIAPRARKLDSICYDDMLELSSAGSGVLQSRAVEFARKWKVVIHSRSAFSEAEGTYVKEEYEMEEAVITGIASDTSEVKVTIRQVPDAPNVAARVFGALAAANVNLDMIIQNVSEAGFTDISFTTPGADLPRAKETMERIVPEIGAREFIVDEDIAKVSLVGTGMKSSPGVASRTFQTLGDNNINIVAISTSPIRLSVVVDGAQAVQAVQCLHTAFGLDSDDVFVETQLSAEEIAAKMKKGR